MDDLDLLRRMAGKAPIPDETTRARMRANLDERMERASAPKRRRSRSAVVAILVAAGVGIGTLAAAAGVIRHWSEDEPVAISRRVRTGDPAAGGARFHGVGAARRTRDGLHHCRRIMAQVQRAQQHGVRG